MNMQGNYNYGMNGELLIKHNNLLKGNHKCNVCKRIGIMAYAKPYICEECSVKIYEVEK